MWTILYVVSSALLPCARLAVSLPDSDIGIHAEGCRPVITPNVSKERLWSCMFSIPFLCFCPSCKALPFHWPSSHIIYLIQKNPAPYHSPLLPRRGAADFHDTSEAEGRYLTVDVALKMKNQVDP